jgi:hypothetical protein
MGSTNTDEREVMKLRQKKQSKRLKERIAVFQAPKDKNKDGGRHKPGSQNPHKGA